jgi:NAD dependent epimerase/dehydratase family enzyme
MRCVEDDSVDGAVDVTAPEATTNAELSKALGRVLHRPAVLTVPGLALKALYGEMAEVVTEGTRVPPERLQELGYHFHHPELEPALRAALGR